MGLFKINDIVLVKDSGVQYKARVIKCDQVDASWKYFVHFDGWKSRYDVWKDESFISEIPVGSTVSRRFGLSAASSEPEPVPSDDATALLAKEKEKIVNSEKRKREEEMDLEMKKHSKMLVSANLTDCSISAGNFGNKIQIPLALKKKCLDEWGLITNEPRRLLKLPAKYSLQAVVHDFLHATKNIEKHAKLMEGMVAFFDKALPVALLYRQERSQYNELVEDYKKHSREASTATTEAEINTSFIPSQIYGVEHLMRFFVNLPKFTVDIVVPEKDQVHFVSQFEELLKFLQKNSGKYFDITSYVECSDVALKESVDWNKITHDAAKIGPIHAMTTDPAHDASEPSQSTPALVSKGSSGKRRKSSSSSAPTATVTNSKNKSPMKESSKENTSSRKSRSPATGLPGNAPSVHTTATRSRRGGR